nr:hypothetical transcript [Hymenolepis microstoma]
MFVHSQNRTVTDPTSYCARLKEHFRSVLPTPPRQNNKPTYIHKDLSTSPFVFVRVDTVKKPLQPPYDGPYKVLQRKSKYFILDRNGTKDSVSIDRLKPAYLESPPKPALAERTHRPKPAIQTADSSVPPPSSPSPNVTPQSETYFVHSLYFERFLPPANALGREYCGTRHRTRV